MIAFLVFLVGAIVVVVDTHDFTTPWFWLLAGLAAYALERAGWISIGRRGTAAP